MPRYKDPNQSNNTYEIRDGDTTKTVEYTTSAAQRRAMNKYESKIENLRIRLPKGYHAEIEKYLEDQSEKQSINAFVKSLIDAKIPGIADRAERNDE